MELSASSAGLARTSIECLQSEAPIAVRVVDLERGWSELRLPLSSDGTPYRGLLALVRRDGRPLGWTALEVNTDGAVSVGALSSVAAHVHELEAQAPESGSALARAGESSFVSIVVATCANVEAVVRCVETIQAAASGDYEVIVVENRPAHSEVAGALDERFGNDERIRCVEEYRPGLACARNAGLRAARGELVAFTDDDVTIDPAWLPAIRAGFASMPDVDCVTGLILPLELETPTQVLVERFAGYAKGFVPRVYALAEPPADQPLFPYTAGYFGSGANMAFRADALRRLGGFDPVLGTGTRARGCEDLDICIRVLNAGSRLAYEPRAVVWHRHPDTDAHLRRRAFDYGAALGAMLTKHLLVGPNRWGMISRAPGAIHYYVSPKSRKNATRGPAFPAGLTRLERAGLLYGPLAYLSSRLDAGRPTALAEPTPPRAPRSEVAMGAQAEDSDANPEPPATSEHRASSAHSGGGARWLGDPRRCATADCLLLALAAATVAVCLLEGGGVARLLLLLASACLIPGAALLTRLPVEDELEAFGLAVGFGFTIEAVGALVMVWSGWWHPFGWAILLGAAACGVLALDLRRSTLALRSMP